MFPVYTTWHALSLFKAQDNLESNGCQNSQWVPCVVMGEAHAVNKALLKLPRTKGSFSMKLVSSAAGLQNCCRLCFSCLHVKAFITHVHESEWKQVENVTLSDSCWEDCVQGQQKSLCWGYMSVAIATHGETVTWAACKDVRWTSEMIPWPWGSIHHQAHSLTY